MKTCSRARSVYASLLSLALLGACAKSAETGDGTGGATTAGTGGATGSGGGSGGSGGSNTGTGGACALTGTRVIGSGGPFPFPQNKKSGMCTLTTHPGAASVVQSGYAAWKGSFVTTASPGMRVRRPGNGDDTVSEGQAYGMLAAVYLNDRPTFDALWAYTKAHLDAKGLMNWRILPSGATAADGAGSATDADEDFAWALIMASNQWGGGTYLDDARTMINAMLAHLVSADGMLKPGDGWGNTDVTFPDYFSPAYFRAYAAVTCDARWTGIIMNRNYEILAQVAGDKGLVPDKTTATLQNMGTYSYDACRTPWRIAMDYCFNGEPRAKAYLDKIGPFFNGIGAANIVDGYSLTGSPTSGAKNMAFIGPAGVAGMAGWPQLLDGAFMFGATNNGGDGAYYPQSLKIITMLMMTGNFLDYTLP